jgi:FkbM family methyltransferase
MSALQNVSENKIAALREFHKRVLAHNGGNWFSFEHYLVALYKGLLKPGHVAVDGGANVGDHALQIAAAVSPGGRVLAVEPVPDHLHKLMTRAAEYGIQPGIMEGVLCGLWHQRGQSEFYQVLHPDQHGLSGLRNREYIKDHSVKRISVELRTLDDICRGLYRLDFLKLDLEGAEWNALQGGRSTINRLRPVIALEQDHQSPQYFGYTWAGLLEYFDAIDYSLYDFFGIRYESAAMMQDCIIWDYVAIPRERESALAVLQAVRQQMEQDGVVEAGATM